MRAQFTDMQGNILEDQVDEDDIILMMTTQANRNKNQIAWAVQMNTNMSPLVKANWMWTMLQ